MRRHRPEPRMSDFRDAKGYVDYEDFDFAWQQWHYEIPSLREFWCPDIKPLEPAMEPSPLDSIDALYEALSA